MASLHEYFVKDGSGNLTIHQPWPLRGDNGAVLLETIAKLHLDFESRACYVSFYVPDTDQIECPEPFVLNHLSQILDWPENQTQVTMGLGGEAHDARDLLFTGAVYIYSERPVTDENRERMISEGEASGHKLVFRSEDYVAERNKWDKPKAFISHDSRDKPAIAEPLASQLQKLMCPVWYDEYSLKVGDSLRESIEAGLKECHKCVFLLTPNFLQNGGWAKREYDSIFTRELVEQSRVILPVWHEVSRDVVYDYSPMLADRVGLDWSLGVETVARKLLAALEP